MRRKGNGNGKRTKPAYLPHGIRLHGSRQRGQRDPEINRGQPANDRKHEAAPGKIRKYSEKRRGLHLRAIRRLEQRSKSNKAIHGETTDRKDVREMFLKKSMFKALLKRAWEGTGLTVGNDGDGIYLIGTYWSIWLESGWISNKTKSIIIEFVGELPKVNEVFKCWKDQDNQYEMEEVYKQALYRPEQLEAEYIDTGISIKEYSAEYQILQNCNTQESVIIAKHIAAMVDNNSCEEGEEWVRNPAGRYIQTNKMTEIFWKNEACVLGCMQCAAQEDSKGAMLMELLKAYDFAKERRRA